MWVKLDDGLHAHRKARRVVASANTKRRDAAPMGLWVLAASWVGQNPENDGWVPEFELDRWDDDWHEHASRLVAAGFWVPEERQGEDGYVFVDWHDYNPSSGASEAGAWGNHKRWHLDRGIVSPDCEHCPAIPHDLDDPDPESGGDIGGRSGGDIAPESRNVALPEPEPEPDPTQLLSPTDVDADAGDRFEEFWNAYAKKDGKKAAQAKWKAALRKKGVTQELLIQAAKRYIAHQRAINKHPEFTKAPATWLNGEHWNDETPHLKAVAGDHYVAKSVDQFGYHDE